MMKAKGVWVITAAAVVVLLVVFAVRLAPVGATPRKPLVPVTNGTFTAVYTAKVMCAGGRTFETDLTLTYRGGRLTRAAIDDYEIPLAAFKYPHQPNYIGEILLDLNKVDKIDNETVKRLGGVIHKRRVDPVPHAELPLAPRSRLLIATSFNYSRLVIEGHGEMINATTHSLLMFDDQANVPYFFIVDIIHSSMRRVCNSSFIFMIAYLKEVKPK